MLIVWDEPKRLENLRVHRLDFAHARDRFEFADALIRPSYAGARGEPRFAATGLLDGDLVTLVFSLLGSEALSLISLRRASRKERRLYGEHQTPDP